MKKEIIIAIICAGLMLGTTFSVVARENTISSNITEKLDVEELVAQIRIVINEILQKYGHIPMVSYLCDILVKSTFVLTWIYLLLYAIFVGIGVFLYVLLKFYYFYY